MSDGSDRREPRLGSAPRKSIDAVRALHAEIDARAGALAQVHAARLQCRRGCSGCCVDDLTVFEIEAARIEREHRELLRDGRPHPPGACAFLGAAGECRIYGARPQVCRTQGFPLRWLAEDARGEIVERRAICELNEPGPALATLAEEACWQLGPAEDRLIRLQAGLDGEGLRRVALRDLFRRSD